MPSLSVFCLGILLATATATPATPNLADEFSELIPALIEVLGDSDQKANQRFRITGPTWSQSGSRAHGWATV